MSDGAVSEVDRTAAVPRVPDQAREPADRTGAAHPAPPTGPPTGRSVALPPDDTARRRAPRGDVPRPTADGLATGELCHRLDPADRFPVEWWRLPGHRFLVSVQWPAAHRFFAPLPDGRQDPLLVAETTRQVTMMLAHAEFGVPVGDHFVMRELGYRVETPAFGVQDASGAIDVLVECSDVHLRVGRVVGMRVDLTFRRQGRVLATGMGVLVCISDRVYRRLRGERLTAPGRPVPPAPGVAPHETGREEPRDVVLAPAEGRPGWLLRLDTTHPTLFARPNDHVPGMVLLEAARQAATALAPGHDFHPASMRISFEKYCELTEPCWILARQESDPEQGAVVRVQGTQREEPVFTAVLGGAPRESR